MLSLGYVDPEWIFPSTFSVKVTAILIKIWRVVLEVKRADKFSILFKEFIKSIYTDQTET